MIALPALSVVKGVLLSKTGIRVLIGIGILAGVGIFYWWADNNGYDRARKKFAAAALIAETENSAANRSALGRELEDATRRAVEETNIEHIIEGNHEEGADDPAHSVIQSVFDSLR